LLLNLNSTHRDLSIVSKKKLDFEPKMIKSIKTRGAHKVLALDGETNKALIFDERFTKQESSFDVPEGEDIIGIIQQPIQLLYYTKKSIGVHRFGSKAMTPQKCQSPPLYEISKLVYDVASPYVLLALSQPQNALLVFEVKGKAVEFTCELRGMLRFGPQLKQINL
jgi:hypothetical protein